jgi:hypothetical protein
MLRHGAIQEEDHKMMFLTGLLLLAALAGLAILAVAIIAVA